MVDRVIVVDGAIPQTTDILNTNKFGMIGLAFLARAILGSSTSVHGLGCTPTSPASLQVNIAPGSIYTLDEADATAYGDLGTDTNTILKQGLLYTTSLLTITPPSTAGYSQVFLVEAALQDVDGGSEVLSFYDAANPSEPFSGPANDGEPTLTLRTCVCTIQLKAGTAAPTGTQVAPSADAGFTPLWLITVANGATTITSGNIVQAPTAPFISPALTGVPAAIQAQAANYAADTGTANAVQIALPSYTSIVAGLRLSIKKGSASNTSAVTLAINGGSPATVQWPDGNALQGASTGPDWPAGAIGEVQFDGTVWELLNVVGPSVFTRQSAGATSVVTASGAFTIASTQKTIGLRRTASLATSSATLPASPSDGEEHWIEDLYGNFNAYPVTISANSGQNIEGAATAVLNVDWQCARFKYYASINQWSFGSLTQL
jgi:hypothetical protein